MFSFIQVFSEKLNYQTGPKIDAKNTNYKKSGGDVKVISYFSKNVLFIYHAKRGSFNIFHFYLGI